MRSRFISSGATILLAGLVNLAPNPVLAGEPNPDSGHHSIALRAYGLFSPSFLGANDQADDRWGAGGAIQWGFNDRWALSLEVASIPVNGKSLRPMVLGMVYGPGSLARFHPWIEAGAGYYPLVERSQITVNRALSSAGNLRDFFGRSSGFDRADAVGGYFGAGLDWRMSSHLGVGTGVRIHNWIEFMHPPLRFENWDGMVTLRSGLSYRF